MNDLFIDLNGRVSCQKHLGAYATAALKRKPNAMNIQTPITKWQRLPIGYDFDCEACRYAKTR